MSSDSEDEALDDLGFDEEASELEPEIDENILGALEEDLAAEASEAHEETDTDDTDSGNDDEDDDEADERQRPLLLPIVNAPPMHLPSMDLTMDMVHPSSGVPAQYQAPSPRSTSPSETVLANFAPSPALRQRSPSPAGLRKLQLLQGLTWPRGFTVEAICAIPHPVPTHSLASSLCMTHLITGSDDGYIRDYDIFAGVNGKVLLSAPQRHHCGVMEGVIKAAQIRYWWENPADLKNDTLPTEETPLCAPYSMLMHSDALWSLAGTEHGHINLFTVRHEPGRRMHTFPGHRGPVSAMAMRHDEKGFYSAGWDGEALEWDLNTGQKVRSYTAHPSQLVAIAVRPLESDYTGIVPWVGQPRFNVTPSAIGFSDAHTQEDMKMPDQSQQLPSQSAYDEQVPSHDQQQPKQEEDVKSDISYDPLFDDDPDADVGEYTGYQSQPQQPQPELSQLSMPGGPTTAQPSLPSGRQAVGTGAAAPAPKNAPPVLDSLSYTMFSSDVLLTASIDGQVMLWDRRVHTPGRGVGRLWMSEKTPPWCVSACWSADGSQIYAGRRNGTIDVWDVRQTGQSFTGTPRVLKIIRNPPSSGVVSFICPFPDGRHIACASTDNIRLWNVAEAGEPDAVSGRMKSGVQFKIIPGHHGGTISQLLVDKQGRFLISASSNRGWFGESSRTVFVHDIKRIW
ncbi:WD40-repeat-containing domain protein [Cytidiella melzeri]|nr:WD40-repeat-containing domain protein [Cytidiella melzeri]